MNFGGAPGGILLLVGPVGSEIAKLELRYQDRRTATVLLHDGWALYEVVPTTTSRDTARRSSSAATHRYTRSHRNACHGRHREADRGQDATSPSGVERVARRRFNICKARMEPLWSPVVATGGNHWQMGLAPKARKQVKTVAIGCDRLRSAVHGKEGGLRFESGRGLC
jgi:hypothetical protein